MTRKVYKTAQGKTVDLGSLMLQNENTRAVGNMKVNARGDLVDGWNRPIDRRTQQVQKQYDRQVTNVRDEPVVSAPTAPTKTKTAKKEAKAESAPDVAVITQPQPVSMPSPQAEPAEKPSGLAAAIARARQIRQDPIQSTQQMAQNKPGVTRI
jgi:hypothetical protein